MTGFPSASRRVRRAVADLAGIVAQADGDDLKTFRMLVTAEPVGEECGHAVGNRLRIGARVEFEDGVHALPEFRIGEADDADRDRRSNAGLWLEAASVPPFPIVALDLVNRNLCGGVQPAARAFPKVGLQRLDRH
jgi:hypothetical protein